MKFQGGGKGEVAHLVVRSALMRKGSHESKGAGACGVIPVFRKVENTLPIWFQGAPRPFNHSAGVMPRARISFAIAFRKSSNHPAMMSGVAYSAPGTGGNCSARKAFP